MTQLTLPKQAIIQNAIPTFNLEKQELKEREKELEDKIRGLAAKVGISDPNNLNIQYKRSFNLEASAIEASAMGKDNKYYVTISPLYALKYEDFPETWRGVTRPNGELVLEVAEQLDQMSVKRRPKQLLIPVGIEKAAALLHVLSNEDQFEKAKDFVITHELSHIKHYEMKKAASVVIFVFEIIQTIIELGRLLISTFIFTPFSYHEADQTSLTLRHVLVDDRAYAYLENREKLTEKYADLDAAAVLKTAEGGLHMFNASQEGNKFLRNIQLNLGNVTYDEQGNTLKSRTHPSYTERKAYLTDWQNRKNLQQVS